MDRIDEWQTRCNEKDVQIKLLEDTIDELKISCNMWRKTAIDGLDTLKKISSHLDSVAGKLKE